MKTMDYFKEFVGDSLTFETDGIRLLVLGFVKTKKNKEKCTCEVRRYVW